jgi:tetratricopeptide (TPR) repeat protein
LDTLNYIDNYFSGKPSAEAKEEFEKRIIDSPEFAEEVSFYLSAKQIAAVNSSERFSQLYAALKKDGAIQEENVAIRKKLWPFLAAAAVIAAIVVGWSVFFRPVLSSGLADKYIRENFQSLGVTMGGAEDSLQTGLRLYNEGKLQESLNQFETILKTDTSSFEAKKYAGIVSLRMNDYDKAIRYFEELSNYTQLYANPGKFYYALTLLKRDRPGDKQEAKNLLNQIVKDDLEGKNHAEEWLKSL